MEREREAVRFLPLPAAPHLLAADQLTRSGLQVDELLRKNEHGELELDVALWLHILGAVHRTHGRARVRELKPVKPSSGKSRKAMCTRTATWGRLHRCNQALPPKHGADRIRRLKSLQHVASVSTDPQLEDTGRWCKAFAKCGPVAEQMTALETLDLVNVQLFDHSEDAQGVLVQVVAKLPNLTTLRLKRAGTVRRNQVMLCTALSRMPHLRTLELVDIELCSRPFREIWQLLPALRHLERLDLSNNIIGSKVKALHSLAWGSGETAALPHARPVSYTHLTLPTKA